MLSAFPPLQTPDGFFGIHLPPFETSLENFDPFFSLPQLEPDFLTTLPVFSHSGPNHKSPSHEPILSKPVMTKIPCSSEPDIVLIEPFFSPSGSDISSSKQKRAKTKTSSCSSDDVEQDMNNNLVIDDRKRRRMISNRESARRSRMRKQKHLENQRDQVNKLRLENRELVNRLRVVTHHLQVVRTDNERLQSESVMLSHRLWSAQQVLMVRELQNQIPSANIMTPINQHILL